MTGKALRNQSFRTLDLLGLVVLVGMVGSISGAILAQALQDDGPLRAHATAEALARQILAQQAVPRSQNLGQRGPASVNSEAPPALTAGDMGKDPWGHPFHYVVRKIAKSKGQIVRVYVWSDGPNGRSDTDADMFEANAVTRHPLKGDDVGFVEESEEL